MMETANEENRSPWEGDMSKTSVTNTADAPSPSTRRILGDVSPNVTVGSSTPVFLKRAIAGSPLKRSFTTAMESGDGFTYLKRRRLADDKLLSQVAEGTSRPVFTETEGQGSLETLPSEEVQPSPTEPNTPSEEYSDTQGSSAERKSFSSLINYDPSSQTSNLVFKSISDAEMLRLHLRVAMYKVRTDQIDVPFADLYEEGQSLRRHGRTAVEEAVAELRREALEVAARQSSSSLQKVSPAPAPMRRPATYCTHVMYETTLPSSPPPLLLLDKLPIANNMATPHREVRPGGSPFGSTQKDPTSSVIKGKVAEGLLGLRNAI